jgi:serine/threonine-protein kinase
MWSRLRLSREDSVPITAGGQLLHYRIVEKIGEGGMGVVWRATDTTLGRDVAIKVLPDAVSADAERVLRFEREARVLAALNHPHVATIHGLHEATPDGRKVHLLVLELVEGEDLEQVLERGPIPLERAVEIATQVATALEAAHAQGIVHRDLKPANVKLTAAGDVKVLDFGLAKALAPETTSGSAPATPSMSPTLTSAGTLAGMILGTAAYMAPEQARGSAVDKRADLWAFGALLYEMLTGERCFAGDTISDTLASVLKEQPDWSRLPAGTPPTIKRLLRRCLAKDPRQRLADAADARLELREAFEDHEVVVAAPDETFTPALASKLPWFVAAAATVVAVAALAAWGLGRGNPATPREPLVLSIPIPADVRLRVNQESVLELSRDGRYVVFNGYVGDSTTTALYLRKLDDATIVKVPDTEGAVNPFFSPDSRWIGFFADGRLKKIQVDGATAIVVCEATGNPRGATWTDDDRIVFPRHFAGALQVVRALGGEPTMLTELDEAAKERTHRWPQSVPGHDVVLFTVATTDSPEFYDDAHIDAVRLSTGVRKTILEGASLARYVPTGHLVFARAGLLYGVPFDIDRLETTGQPVPVLEGVTGAATSGVVYASISGDGLLAYVPGRPENPRKRLRWMFADGRDEEPAGVDEGSYVDTAVSPDGRHVAFAQEGERSQDLWVLDLERESRVRLTFEGENWGPVWMRDGKTILFSSVRDGWQAVYMTAADGTGGERLVYRREGVSVTVTDVSPDGRLAILEVYADNRPDIFVKPLDDPDAEVVPFLTGPADERSARFSPDGRFVAYVSDAAGDYQVFVRPFPGPGGRWQISNHGGVDPHWSPDGKQIHYRNNRGWWVVDVEPGDGAALRTGLPRLVRDDLPRAQLASTNGLSAAGDALLVATDAGNDRTGAEEIRVMTDWFTRLNRLMATQAP